MAQIFFIGECMVELRAKAPDIMYQSFAGDVYNSAVYLKRCFSQINCGVVTCIGTDSLSRKMLNAFKHEHLATDYVFHHSDKVAGLYLVETDNTGEKSFTYWRNDSAARTLTTQLSSQVISAMANADICFVSGISLAVILPEHRTQFWQKLVQLKSAGTKIVFDPNYRPKLWENVEQARNAFEQMMSIADVILPGVEDFSLLYDMHDVNQIIQYCQNLNCDEIVLKNGDASVISIIKGQVEEHCIEPELNVVDTTSAGDAFNGVYLGARLLNIPVEQAINHAAQIAKIVVKHPGAIVEQTLFEQAISKLPNFNLSEAKLA